MTKRDEKPRSASVTSVQPADLTPPVLVNGTLCVDTLEFPDGSRYTEQSGGAAVYFALAARLLAPVRLLGAVGRDYPEAFVDHLRDAGVDLAGLVRRGGKTFRWTGSYHHDLDDRDTLGLHIDPAVEALPPVPEAYRDSRFVFLGVNAPENQLALRRALPAAQLVMADTIDLYVHQHAGALLEVLREIDGLLINEHEAFDLTGRRAPEDSAAAILELGPRFVVVKRGPRGSLLRHRDEGRALPIPPCVPDNLVDPTGAGDSFAGGMLGRLAQRNATADDIDTLAEAARYGAVMASFTLEGVATSALRALTRAAFDARLACDQNADENPRNS